MKFTLTLMFLQTALFSFGATISKVSWRHLDNSTAYNSSFQLKSVDALGNNSISYYVALNGSNFVGTSPNINDTHVQGSTTGHPSDTNLALRSNGWHSYELEFTSSSSINFSMDGGAPVSIALTNTSAPTIFSMAYRGIESTGGVDQFMSIDDLVIELDDGSLFSYDFDNPNDILGDEWSVFRQDSDAFYRVNNGVFELGKNTSNTGTQIMEYQFSIPEPSSTALLGLSGLSLLTRRKRN